jgi:hypothetical protein
LETLRERQWEGCYINGSAGSPIGPIRPTMSSKLSLICDVIPFARSPDKGWGKWGFWERVNFNIANNVRKSDTVPVLNVFAQPLKVQKVPVICKSPR